MTKGAVLLVDDDAAVRDALAQTLDLADFDVQQAGSFVAAKDMIAADFQGVILSDIRMPGRDGFYLLDYAHQADPDLPVVLLTGEGDVPMAVQAMRQGAFGFLEKPCDPADLVSLLDRAMHTRRLVVEHRQMTALAQKGDPAARMLFGQSTLAQDLRARVRRVAQTSTEVLVTGAPGTGISKVAEIIHLCSARSKAPFEKRAAAGLGRDEVATALDAAKGGTLFLDEIAALPADTQIALIEILEQGPPTRLIAGSTVDLQEAVQQGKFNADLYYRLDVTPVYIPALSERPEDIPVLFRHFVAQASEQAGLKAPDITADVIAGLMAQDWPGNSRSLMSAAMRFALGMGDEPSSAGNGLGLAERMAQVERSLLIEALRECEGQAGRAAQALKLPRKTFYDKLSKYDLKASDYK